MLDSVGLMQQYNFDALIQKEHRFNRLEKEEVILRNWSTSLIIEKVKA